MAEPKTAIEEELSLREVAFEYFERFFESIIEQSQFTPDQQLALGEQLKAGVKKRGKLGNRLAWLEGQADLLRGKEKQQCGSGCDERRGHLHLSIRAANFARDRRGPSRHRGCDVCFHLWLAGAVK